MFRFIFAMLFSVCCSAGSIFEIQSMKITFSSFGSGIAANTLNSVQELISEEVKKGKVELYKQSHWGLEGEVTICLEADDSTLSRLKKAFERLPNPFNKPAPQISLSADGCEQNILPTIVPVSEPTMR